ncbi:UNVERIFIED_CONTAM: hypothetical protein Sradi_7253000, partial [Sesamum radiatum]
MLHQRAKMAWLKDGDQCSRIFFRKVAKRRASKRVFQINTADGRTLTSQSEVIHEFIRYYEELLGGTTRDRLIDLRYLRPWARHILTVDEAEALILPVSPAEIKQAIFDIDETKAPDQMGIQQDSTRLRGRDWRGGDTGHIGILSVWEAITKILVQRLRRILDTLISPSQNAFVPGRSIGDNILLAQELFSGYNQRNQPPRCALKVDLRKAYDTVEWDFLKAALTLFGFPERFIQWIVECVTTPSYSVCFNGAPHGFFRGTRGLRQGDPMSPFLFVLVMEVLTLILVHRIEQTGEPAEESPYPIPIGATFRDTLLGILDFRKATCRFDIWASPYWPRDYPFLTVSRSY